MIIEKKTLTLLRNTTSIVLNRNLFTILSIKAWGAELFASATCDMDENNTDCQFHCHLSGISLALMQKKTVILKGELSIYAYTAMQNLFSPHAQIKLPNAAKPQYLPGLLIIVTPKLNYPTLVADQYGPPENIFRLCNSGNNTKIFF